MDRQRSKPADGGAGTTKIGRFATASTREVALLPFAHVMPTVVLVFAWGGTHDLEASDTPATAPHPPSCRFSPAHHYPPLTWANAVYGFVAAFANGSDGRRQRCLQRPIQNVFGQVESTM